MQPALLWNGDLLRPMPGSSFIAFILSNQCGQVLGIKPANPDDLRWRLLRVNFDVLALYAKAIKIGDLLGYQRAVDEACETVKKLIEEEYPVGVRKTVTGAER